MSSQTGIQTTTINILPDISKIKGNRTMKFSQWIEYIVRNNFLQKSCRKWGGRLVPDFFLYVIRTLYDIKASG